MAATPRPTASAPEWRVSWPERAAAALAGDGQRVVARADPANGPARAAHRLAESTEQRAWGCAWPRTTSVRESRERPTSTDHSQRARQRRVQRVDADEESTAEWTGRGTRRRSDDQPALIVALRDRRRMCRRIVAAAEECCRSIASASRGVPEAKSQKRPTRSECSARSLSLSLSLTAHASDARRSHVCAWADR